MVAKNALGVPKYHLVFIYTGSKQSTGCKRNLVSFPFQYCKYHMLQVMPRLMIGIGRPADKADVVDYVLEEFTPDQLSLVESIMSEALRTMMSHMEKKCAEITEAKTRTEDTDTQGNE